MSSRGYPESWPKPCPPADAIQADGIVYRLCKRNPPIPRDLQSHHERGVCNPDRDPCNQCGLSVALDEAELAHLARFKPSMGRFILVARLSGSQGLMKHKPNKEVPSHHNLWLFSDVDRARLFALHRPVTQ